MVPKLRSQGYIPFFVTARKRSETALIQVIQEAFVQGVSSRKMEKLAHSLGIENLSRSQASEMTKGLNEQVQEFRGRSLESYCQLFQNLLNRGLKTPLLAISDANKGPDRRRFSPNCRAAGNSGAVNVRGRKRGGGFPPPPFLSLSIRKK